MARIGIDARFYGPEGTGIGRYVEKLLENLEKIDQQNEYFVFLRASNFPLYNPKADNFTKVKADARWYSAKEQVIMPSVLLKQKLDLVHFPHFNIPLLYPGKFIVTIHDLTKSSFGGGAASTRALPVYLAKQNLYKVVLNQAISKARMILTPSQFVKKELVEKMKVKEEKIVVTYEGADDFYDPNFSPSEGRIAEVLGKYSIKKPYLIYVGNMFPYKNVEVVLKSLLDLEPKVKFVLVSPRNKFLEKIIENSEKLGVRNRLVTTGFVPDEELKLLLNQAEAFLFPSKSEGFGLPGLEAMGVGCPVIAAKATSLPEVYEEAAEYFDPNSSKELVRKINTVSKTKIKKKPYCSRFPTGKKILFKKMAEQTLKVYKIESGK